MVTAVVLLTFSAALSVAAVVMLRRAARHERDAAMHYRESAAMARSAAHYESGGRARAAESDD